MTKAGYASESEVDEEAATVTLASDLGRVNRASAKSAVKLQELGQRMTLQLVKVEEVLCGGGVIFNDSGNFDSKNKKDDKDSEKDSEDNNEDHEDEDGEFEEDEEFEDEKS